MIDEEDRVHSFGSGLYGQLGIGVEEDKAKKPVLVDDVNDEKVLMIACGAHFSICYTEFGILYYWGMLVPEDISSIQWIPNFMSISPPKDLTELELLSFHLVDIQATFREILACDS
jgi:alpha-tubulin suppressor-like RCC1 family protein